MAQAREEAYDSLGDAQEGPKTASEGPPEAEEVPQPADARQEADFETRLANFFKWAKKEYLLECWRRTSGQHPESSHHRRVNSFQALGTV